MFAPSLTAFSGRKIVLKVNHIFCGADITYENGAKVPTSFVTSFGGGIVARSAPELGRRINDAVKKAKPSKTMPKYAYPDNIVTASILEKFAKYGIEYSVSADEAICIRELDDQKRYEKGIYGNGLLVSDHAAAEKAAAEKAAAERAAAERAAYENRIVFKLSERELAIVKNLNNNGGTYHEI